MNLDNSAIIEIIPLGNRPVEAGCVTEKMREIIEDQVSRWKKTLIFYNRRGSASAWICEDCGYFEKCQNCDIAFSYHTHPKKHLLCHQCSVRAELPSECPHCHGAHFRTVGVGIEQVAEALEKISGYSVEILDSDHISRTREIPEKIENSHVILSTNLGHFLSDERIGAIIFALFEVNISIPEYDLEEEIYTQISYCKKQKKPLYIQTFAPEHPLLREIVFGNYKSYLEVLKSERKKFSYPPFVDFVSIRVHHKDKHMVQNTISGLMERIRALDTDSVFVAYDKEIFEKFHGQFMQKIILKGKGVSDILESLENTIIRSRCIYVDWH